VAVYVDDARVPWRGRRWSHLVADTADELQAAAQALGLPRAAAQERGRTLHYDLPDEWREAAIERGIAEPIDRREMAERLPSLAPGRRARSRVGPRG
jgi:Protein of unknown function (DUF4031)